MSTMPTYEFCYTGNHGEEEVDRSGDGGTALRQDDSSGTVSSSQERGRSTVGWSRGETACIQPEESCSQEGEEEMTRKEFEDFKQKTEAEILKLRLDTERRFNATSKLLQMGGKMLVRIEDKIDSLTEAMISPSNGAAKKAKKK
jgi:hypothetical protein